MTPRRSPRSDWLESGEDPKLSTFSMHSVACNKDLIFGKVPRRPPNHVGHYRCGTLPAATTAAVAAARRRLLCRWSQRWWPSDWRWAGSRAVLVCLPPLSQRYIYAVRTSPQCGTAPARSLELAGRKDAPTTQKSDFGSNAQEWILGVAGGMRLLRSGRGVLRASGVLTVCRSL
jgi:hypothetical protein